MVSNNATVQRVCWHKREDIRIVIVGARKARTGSLGEYRGCLSDTDQTGQGRKDDSRVTHGD